MIILINLCQQNMQDQIGKPKNCSIGIYKFFSSERTNTEKPFQIIFQHPGSISSD